MLLLTGAPGVGKTTVMVRAVEALKTRCFNVGGMVSLEVREGGVRVGFEILDLASGKRGWLASVNHKVGPQVGKYNIHLNDLDVVGAQAITAALANCDVVVIDEVGPMELFSEKFKEAVQKVLASQKVVLMVVHWKATDNLVFEAKGRDDAEIITVTPENRDKLPDQIVEKVTCATKSMLF